MTALALPRFWPPQHWAMCQRLRDPAEALWSELRMARGEVDVVDLMVRAIEHCEDAFAHRGDAFRQFDRLLEDWVSRGLVAGTGHPVRYRLSREYLLLRSPPPPPAPQRRPFPKRTQQQRLWAAMKVLRTFDLPTLLMAAQASRRGALDLINKLERCGWLRRTPAGWSTAGVRAWGPVAPTIARIDGAEGPAIRVTDQRDGSVIDLPVRRQRRDRRLDSSTDALAGGGVS